MKYFSLNSKDFKHKYNILIKSIPFGFDISGHTYFTWLKIPPHTQSVMHKHYELEGLIVIQGYGHIQCEASIKMLKPGDFFLLDAFENHALINNHTETDLVLMSIVIADDKKAQLPMLQTKFKQNYLIISTPPTPNGDLHLGHIAGPYLRADIIKRYLTCQGVHAYHYTGQDDHQSYTAFKAKERNESPQITADFYGTQIQTTLHAADIQLDYFMQPNKSAFYKKRIIQLCEKLFRANKIIIKHAETLICRNCDIYLYEVYVKGNCPHCHEITGGNFCEVCGKINDCADLLNPRCKLCHTSPEKIKFARAFFPLQSYVKELKTYHANASLNARLRNYCDHLYMQALPEIPVSHFSNWGIPCPGLEGQIISVWFEMGLAYVHTAETVFKQNSADYDSDTHVIQCFGFDNSFFNAFVFPAIYFALNEGINPAAYLLVNEFYALDSLKFSTSRNHLIWAKDYFQTYPSDLVRWYLCKTNPEDYQTSFNKNEFLKFINFLQTSLQNWFNQINTRLEIAKCTSVPATGLWQEKHTIFYARLQFYVKTLENYYALEYLSLSAITQTLQNLMQEAINFLLLTKNEVGLQEDEHRTTFALHLLAIKIFTLAAHPIMPKITSNLWQTLGYKHAMGWNLLSFVPEGQALQHFLPKITADCSLSNFVSI